MQLAQLTKYLPKKPAAPMVLLVGVRQLDLRIIILRWQIIQSTQQLQSGRLAIIKHLNSFLKIRYSPSML